MAHDGLLAVHWIEEPGQNKHFSRLVVLPPWNTTVEPHGNQYWLFVSSLFPCCRILESLPCSSIARVLGKVR